LSSSGFAPRDQIGDRVDAELGIDEDRIRRGAEFGDRREILEGIIGHLGIKAGIDHVGARADQQRIAVRLGMGHVSDPDIAAGARAVLDNDIAGQREPEILAEDSRHDVGGAGRRERNDDLDRPLRIARRLGAPDAKPCSHCGADHTARRTQDIAARSKGELYTEHGVLPMASHAP
jgi:hypothetical protein